MTRPGTVLFWRYNKWDICIKSSWLAYIRKHEKNVSNTRARNQESQPYRHKTIDPQQIQTSRWSCPRSGRTAHFHVRSSPHYLPSPFSVQLVQREVPRLERNRARSCMKEGHAGGDACRCCQGHLFTMAQKEPRKHSQGRQKTADS